MSLTRPIPKAAMRIVKILRAEVPRPRTLPKITSAFLIKKRHLRWRPNHWSFCPMGLHPDASDSCPETIWGFLPDRVKSLKAIRMFWGWWDEQADAKAAVDAVWPKAKKKAKP